MKRILIPLSIIILSNPLLASPKICEKKPFTFKKAEINKRIIREVCEKEKELGNISNRIRCDFVEAIPFVESSFNDDACRLEKNGAVSHGLFGMKQWIARKNGLGDDPLWLIYQTVNATKYALYFIDELFAKYKNDWWMTVEGFHRGEPWVSKNKHRFIKGEPLTDYAKSIDNYLKRNSNRRIL